MPAARADEWIAQLAAKRLEGDRVQAYQADIAKGCCQLAAIIEFRNGAGPHGTADVQQKPHRYTRLNLKHFQKKLFKAKVGPPVDRPQVITMVKMPVIQEFLTRAREAGNIVSSNKTGERLLPANR